MENQLNDELDSELWDLAKEVRGQNPPAGLVAATIGLLASRREKLRTLPKVAPAFLAALLLLVLSPLFFLILHPTLNTAKIFLATFSLAAGSVFIFYPERMAFLDQKLLGKLLANRGPAATPRQEMVLFRVQGLYFVMISVLICRL